MVSSSCQVFTAGDGGVERDQVGHRGVGVLGRVAVHPESGLVSCHWLLNHFSRPLNRPTRPRASSLVRQSAVCFCRSK